MDITVRAVESRLRATGAAVFEVGLLKPAVVDGREAELPPRTWDRAAFPKSIPRLRYRNRAERNVYVRPQEERRLSPVDDLTPDAIRKMKAEGFSPDAVVETSPGNFRVWLNQGQVPPREESTAAARKRALRFGGDRGSTDWRRFGRIARFANRKLRHARDGVYPFVLLKEANGAAYDAAPAFPAELRRDLHAAKREAERRRREYAASGMPNERCRKDIDRFRSDPTYDGDGNGNRIDQAYAIYALSHGGKEVEARAAIATRDLTKKGGPARWEDYIARTVRSSYRALGCLGIGRQGADRSMDRRSKGSIWQKRPAVQVRVRTELRSTFRSRGKAVSARA
jgi:hypothetical protein